MAQATPSRGISVPVATAIVVANMVGTGVFTSLGFQVGDLPSGFPILLLWVLGGLLSFCGAVCYAELSAMMPRSGGEYHLLRESWHPLVGFLSGWVSMTVGFAAPVAAAAMATGAYLVEAVPAMQSGGRASASINFEPFIATAAVLLLTWLHLGKLPVTGRVQLVLTSLKIALILILIGAAFLFVPAQPVSFLPAAGDGALIRQPAFAVSLFFVMYAYTGWNATAYVVDEIKNPTRNLPLSMFLGTGLVMALYVALNAAFLHAAPMADLAAAREKVSFAAARAIFGKEGGTLMGLCIAFGLLSTISAMTWAGPRVGQTIGQDYSLLRFLARTNRHGVPHVAILCQAAIVIALVWTATFEQVILYIQGLLILSSLMVVAGLFWLRWRQPKAPRPYRAWGYPVTPLLYIAVSIYMLYHHVRMNSAESLWGLITLVMGLIVFFLSRPIPPSASTPDKTAS